MADHRARHARLVSAAEAVLATDKWESIERRALRGGRRSVRRRSTIDALVTSSTGHNPGSVAARALDAVDRLAEARRAKSTHGLDDEEEDARHAKQARYSH